MTAIAMTTFGALPAVSIRSADGAEAIVTLYGAHLVSWTGADGVQRLFCSAKSALDGSRAIRGGVPIIFPQFAERGSGMRHGFARVSEWRLADSGEHQGEGFAIFVLGEAYLAPAVRAAWPHAFTLRLRVAVTGERLSMTLDVTNTGTDAFAFSSALHTYFSVDAIGDVGIGGVAPDLLRIDDKIDHLYAHVKGEVTLAQPRGRLRLEQTGFRDVVVWNPGAADTAALADMEEDDYLRFVCIEAALIEAQHLAPGASWRGEQQVSSLD